MRPVVSWGDLCVLEYSGVSWGYQTDPLNLVQYSYSFHKSLLYFLNNQHLQSSRPYKQIIALYLFLCIRCVSVKVVICGKYINLNKITKN